MLFNVVNLFFYVLLEFADINSTKCEIKFSGNVRFAVLSKSAIEFNDRMVRGLLETNYPPLYPCHPILSVHDKRCRKWKVLCKPLNGNMYNQQWLNCYGSIVRYLVVVCARWPMQAPSSLQPKHHPSTTKMAG